MKYDFKCRACESEFTVEHGVDESHPIFCPFCYSSAIHRLWNKTSVIYKDDGFTLFKGNDENH